MHPTLGAILAVAGVGIMLTGQLSGALLLLIGLAMCASRAPA